MNIPENNHTPKLRFPEFIDNWEVKKLGEIGKFISGGTPSTQNEEFWQGNIPWISSSDLTGNSIFSIKITRYITENAILKSATKLVPAKSVLIVSRVGVGKVAVNENPICTSQDFANLILSKNDYIFCANLIKLKTAELLEFNQGTSIKGFVKSDLENLNITLPTLPEQTKIGNFLTAVDTKIQGLRKEKDLLEQYKKGMMQRIFPQTLRFKDADNQDFPNWEVKKLGEVAKFSKGKGVSKNDIIENGKTECIRYGELYTIYNETISEVKSRTNVEPKNLVLSEANDVIIPSSGESELEIATASCVLKSGVALGGDLNIIKTKNNGVFLSYYLNNIKKYDISKLAQGTSVVHLYSTQLALLDLNLPTLPEQTKIANFLTAIDEKISNCAERLEKMEVWKKGLLQQMFV